MAIFHVVVLILLKAVGSFAVGYQPTWESLDSRPLPEWYDEAKFGIFAHWGVYSAMAIGFNESAWMWRHWKMLHQREYMDFMKKNYPPNFKYQDFAKTFKAELFNASEWAQLFKKSGARYFVLTSKHHEGFNLWRSNVSWNWNSVDIGPHKDLVGELSKAIRNETNIRFGLYYSLYEWFNPLYIKDCETNFQSKSFVESKVRPELHDIVNTYQPDIVWSDGDWDAPDNYWDSQNFLAWLYNESPVKDKVVVNDRWGYGIMCRHGGFLTCADKYNPGKLMERKWENAMTIDRDSWGFRKNTDYKDYLSTKELIIQLISTVSFGGNLLLNVSPTGEGKIPPIFQERLLQIGDWLRVNGEAIYGTKPWRVQKEASLWYTSKRNSVFAMFTVWPKNGLLKLEAPKSTKETKVHLLGVEDDLPWKMTTDNFVVDLADVKVHLLPSWAWTLHLVDIY